MLELDDFSHLTSMIYASALNHALWSDVLEFLHVRKQGMKLHLFGYDAESGTHLGHVGVGYDSEFEKTYESRFFRRNVFLKRYFQANPGVPVPTAWMLPFDDLRRTEFYNDWLRPQEDLIGGGSLLLFREEGRMITFGSNIRARDIDRLEGPWLAELRRLAPHLRQSFEISRALAGSAIEKQAALAGVDVTGTGLLVLARDRRIVYANASAQSLIDGGALVQSRKGRLLHFADPASDDRFDAELRRFGALVTPGPATLVATTPDGLSRWQVRLAPIDPGRLDYSPAGILIGPREPALLMTLCPDRTLTLRQRLMEAFMLTAQEAEIVQLVAEGLSASDIAAMRERSIHTVRNQIKSSMSKMDVSRQVELVRLVNALAGSPQGSGLVS